MHTTKSSDKITPFGGFNFCLESYHDCGLARLIDLHLGPRVQMAGFSYSDIMANLMGVLFTGGDCAEDLADWRPFDGQNSSPPLLNHAVEQNPGERCVNV